MSRIFSKCESVIVYRCSPSQKAKIVSFVRKHVSSGLSSLVTMAIGDGANDVNMIQTAHIGIGIQGKEGNQAASFADYTLPKFQDLR
jgi:P-type E1-E2 ATPase